ncbi:hypothetical protein BDN72DRAFT_110525 [Pluteus cervinus]|uniref:Uncharacterized protein n=1 Tax=Pluteus cervinus TaxID=181527 RepID=A0ACD3APK2_9AGAR|nr:hypothetical protein BDN72DRAFT_110525 [Pluteus cervinus]
MLSTRVLVDSSYPRVKLVHAISYPLSHIRRSRATSRHLSRTRSTLSAVGIYYCQLRDRWFLLQVSVVTLRVGHNHSAVLPRRLSVCT